MRRRPAKLHRYLPLTAAIFISLLCTGYSVRPVHADSYAYGAGYFGEYSGNIRRAPAEPQSEWIDSVIAGAVYNEDGPVFDVHLLGQTEYRNYRNNTYDDGQNSYADTSLIWRVAPQQLHWFLADRYSQLTRDVTLPDTPDNRVNANVLSTGPDLYIRLGQVTALDLGLRYGSAIYSDGDLDSHRYGATARWRYATLAETTYSLNYETEQIRYSNEVENENLQKQDSFIRINKRQNNNNFQMDLGATRLDRDRTGETSGYLMRIKSARQLTSISTMGLTLAGEYLDAGNVLLATSSGTGSAPGASSPANAAGGVTNDFSYTKRIEGYYHRNDDNYGLDARAYYRDIDYDFSQQDRRESGGRLEATHQRDNQLTTAAYGSHIVIKYLNSSRNDRESEAGIRLHYRIDKNYTATLDSRRTWRNSTDAFQNYADNRILISLSYSSSSLFIPRPELTGGRAAPSFQVQEAYLPETNASRDPAKGSD